MNIIQSNHRSELHIHNNHGETQTPFDIMLMALTKYDIPINPKGEYHLDAIMQNAKDFIQVVELMTGLHDIQTKYSDPYPIYLSVKLTNGSYYDTGNECWDIVLLPKSSINGHTYFHVMNYVTLPNGDGADIEKYWPIDQVESITFKFYPY